MVTDVLANESLAVVVRPPPSNQVWLSYTNMAAGLSFTHCNLTSYD